MFFPKGIIPVKCIGSGKVHVSPTPYVYSRTSTMCNKYITTEFICYKKAYTLTRK